MKTKQEALKQKELEVQSQLSDWAKTSGLFSIGDKIKVTIELASVSPLTVDNYIIGSLDSNRPTSRGRRYVNVTNNITEAEWKIILSCSLVPWQKQALEHIKSNHNQPTDGSEIIKVTDRNYFDRSALLERLKKNLVPFRIRIVGRNKADVNYMYQVFKVSIRV